MGFAWIIADRVVSVMAMTRERRAYMDNANDDRSSNGNDP